MAPASFRAFTIKANGRADRIVTTVTVCEAFDPANPPPQMPTGIETNALWDTGATKSVLSAATVSALGLTPVGSANVNHAGGTSCAHTYLVNLTLPNHVTFAGVLVSGCDALQAHFGAIIGMDIITAGDLSLTNVGGRTWMSFRIPSIQTIDYVEEAQRSRFAGIGRNDPCPCGKRRPNGQPIKFKHCHGAPPLQQPSPSS